MSAPSLCGEIKHILCLWIIILLYTLNDAAQVHVSINITFFQYKIHNLCNKNLLSNYLFSSLIEGENFLVKDIVCLPKNNETFRLTNDFKRV